MKKQYSFLMLVALVLIFSTSCGKKIEEVNPNFIGFWQGSDATKSYTIRIEEDGQGRYSYTGGGEMGSAEGRVRYRNGKLKIGPFKGLEINNEPKLLAGVWTMEADGVTYTRTN